mgnify:CR=1 FL=1
MITVPKISSNTEKCIKDKKNTNEGSQYQTLASVMSDEDLKNQVLNRAFKEFETLQKKYQEYEELFKIFRQVGIARRKYDKVNREERPGA